MEINAKSFIKYTSKSIDKFQTYHTYYIYGSLTGNHTFDQVEYKTYRLAQVGKAIEYTRKLLYAN